MGSNVLVILACLFIGLGRVSTAECTETSLTMVSTNPRPVPPPVTVNNTEPLQPDPLPPFEGGLPPPETVFERRDGSTGRVDQILMAENFFPDYIHQRPIDSPIHPPIGILNPSLIIGNDSVNGT